jgi:hypothetical protein
MFYPWRLFTEDYFAGNVSLPVQGHYVMYSIFCVDILYVRQKYIYTGKDNFCVKKSSLKEIVTK